MMTKLNSISDADKQLFRNSVGPVQKVKTHPAPVRKPRSVPEQRITSTRSKIANDTIFDPLVNELHANDELFFKRSGIQLTAMTRLRKGKFPIERKLDLHGMNSKDAKTALDRFLQHCQQHDIRHVRIIHGKGLGSRDGKPVIKNRVNQWLQNIPQVLAFCSARERDGGAGAIYVMLKRNSL